MTFTRRLRANRWLAVLSLVLLWGAHLLDSTGAVTTTTDKNIKPPHENTEFTAVRVAGPFEFPSSIAFLPGASMLVAERPGRLSIVQPGSAARHLTGIPPVLYAGHAGLLDIALDPAFATNAIVYISYAHGTEEASVVRVTGAHLDLQKGTLTDPQMIFESAPRQHVRS